MALANEPHLSILSLYGDLSLAEQEKVIAPTMAPERKIVLATAIAQTSLTIEGIRVVVDSGLSREARFDANTATTRLHTRRATQAETTQRAGRAGRTQAGVCYRWWSAEQQHRLAAQAQPQIECLELSALTLNLAQWGIQDRLELDWITPPPQGHFQQSLDTLRQLNAISEQGLTLTPHGERMSQLNLEPRLAHLLLLAKPWGISDLACQACALLSEGDPLSNVGSDFHLRLHWLADKDSKLNAQKPKHFYQQSIKQWRRHFSNIDSSQFNRDKLTDKIDEEEALGLLLAAAFFDRIAQRQDNPNHAEQKRHYKLANGRLASLDKTDGNAQFEYLVALDVGGHQGHNQDQIYLSHPLNLSALAEYLPELQKEVTHLAWSKKEARLISEQQTWVGKLCVQRKASQRLSDDAVTTAVIQHVKQAGLAVLPWNQDTAQLRARLHFAVKHDTQHAWPDWRDEGLLNTLETWLAPYLAKVTTQSALDKLDLKAILLNSLSWPQQSRLKEKVPERLAVASGNQHKIDYQQSPPKLSVKLQEAFGMTSTPQVLGQNLSLELLSPAQRPLAVTHDLPFFWQNAYPEIKKRDAWSLSQTPLAR